MAKEAATQQDQDLKTRIRIKVKSYDHKVIDQSVRKIIDTAVRTGAKIIGPVPLPTAIKKVTVNKSTFVNEDSRDQYEVRTHKRLIDIVEPSDKTIEELTNLDLPAGVGIEIKM
jgi:small subunit ribosomal protein S10